jgi:hypothetical protein
MRGIELRKKYKEEENTKVEITEVNDRTFINTEYVFWLEDMLVKNLSLQGVSHRRELLFRFANDWNNEGWHSEHILESDINRFIEKEPK